MNGKQKKLINKGRWMSSLLRHKPDNLNMDEFGFVDVKELTNKLEITYDDLQWIVDNNDKKRFMFDGGNNRIRAIHGHSIPIILTLNPVEPPHSLFHGTAIGNKLGILKNGILKMNRHHIHLSEDKDTAISVGMRHAKKKENLWIISISAKLMDFEGYKFYKTENDVWLVDHVPPSYINNAKELD